MFFFYIFLQDWSMLQKKWNKKRASGSFKVSNWYILELTRPERNKIFLISKKFVLWNPEPKKSVCQSHAVNLRTKTRVLFLNKPVFFFNNSLYQINNVIVNLNFDLPCRTSPRRYSRGSPGGFGSISFFKNLNITTRGRFTEKIMMIDL